jgi:hypothetical protein
MWFWKWPAINSWRALTNWYVMETKCHFCNVETIFKYHIFACQRVINSKGGIQDRVKFSDNFSQKEIRKSEVNKFHTMFKAFNLCCMWFNYWYILCSGEYMGCCSDWQCQIARSCRVLRSFVESVAFICGEGCTHKIVTGRSRCQGAATQAACNT